ncbi:MAG TPA: hypothetical protein VMS78_10095 [Rhizomicrobium sp.]|nr:hypothetical protein [Rhizomicrobium sp.]
MRSGKIASVIAPAFVAAVLLWPLWSVVLPAMTDYPAHVSALYVQMHAHDPAFTRFYQTEWDFVPDLASEILVPLFSTVLPFLTSVKVFMSLALVMWVAAPFAVQYALYRRVGVTALAGALFAYNAGFTWGFINFYFAAGLALLLFAAWIATEKHGGPLRTAAFALATIVLLYAHALGVFLLAILLLFFEMVPVEDDRRGSLLRRMGTVALVLLPATLCFLFLRPAATGAHEFSFNFFSSIPRRIEAAMQDGFDTAAFFPLAVLGLLVIAGILTKRVSLHPRMIAVLSALAVFCLLAPTVAGGGWGMHIRFPAAFCLLFFAAMDVKLEPRVRAAFAAIAVTLAVINAATLFLSWRTEDRQYAEFRSAMNQVPSGSKLFTVLDEKALGGSDTRVYRHMAEYAIMDRAVFVPLMFTTRGQHVVHTRAEYEPIASLSSAQGHEAPLAALVDFARGDFRADESLTYLNRWPCNYDQVIVIHLGKPQSPVPSLLQLKQAYSFFSLYEVVRPDICKTGVQQVNAG